MDVLYEVCCGLDVHKATVVACVRRWGKGEKGGKAGKRGECGQPGRRSREVRTFGTMTEDLLRLGDWLLAAGCTHAAMEATGVLWSTP